MQDLSLHILDIAENAVRAGATTITVRLAGDDTPARMTLSIEDDGSGMDRETVVKACDPFFSTKDGKRTGLGLSLLAQAAEETGGSLRIVSEPGMGTAVTAVFDAAHPDMKPLGDIVETFGALMAGSPQVRFIFDCRLSGEQIYFDSKQISEEAHK